MPWFILWFVLAAAANSVVLVPVALHAPMAALVGSLITLALSAIGLQTSVASLKSAGLRPLVLGCGLWIAVAAAALAQQR